MKKFLFTTFFSLYTLAAGPDIEKLTNKGYKIYKVQKGETLATIAAKLHSKLNYKFQNIEDFQKFLVQWNPHLKKVADITGQIIYVNNPFPPQISYKWAPDLSQTESEAMAEVDFVNLYQGINEKKRAPASVQSKTRWVRFIHATLSQGKFLDTIGNNKIDSQQNSPFTIGAGFVYLLEDYKDYSIASSAYYSNLQASNINDASNTVDNKGISLPAEIGANIYLQKNLQSTINAVYGGFDYEQFNTLNFDEIIEGETTTLDSQRQTVLFATAGLGLTFQFIKPTTMKFSASQAVSSSTEFGGTKYMMYLNQKLTNNFWYHILYKQHMLSGTSRDVSISRYGIGVGMAF